MEDSNNKLREENEKLRAESERKAISNERLLTSYVIPRMEERIRSLEGTVKRQAKELWEARAEIEALRKGLKHNETGNKEVFEVSHGGGDQGSSKDEKHCEQNEQNKQFEKKEFMREQKKFLELAKQEIKTYKENSEQATKELATQLAAIARQKTEYEKSRKQIKMDLEKYVDQAFKEMKTHSMERVSQKNEFVAIEQRMGVLENSVDQISQEVATHKKSSEKAAKELTDRLNVVVAQNMTLKEQDLQEIKKDVSCLDQLVQSSDLNGWAQQNEQRDIKLAELAETMGAIKNSVDKVSQEVATRNDNSDKALKEVTDEVARLKNNATAQRNYEFPEDYDDYIDDQDDYMEDPHDDYLDDPYEEDYQDRCDYDPDYDQD